MRGIQRKTPVETVEFSFVVGAGNYRKMLLVALKNVLSNKIFCKTDY